MSTNRIKKYLKLYTGKATKLEMVLWLRDECAVFAKKPKFIDWLDSTNTKKFKENHFVALLLSKLGIDPSTININWKYHSTFFISNPIVFEVLTTNNLICLELMDHTVKSQQLLKNRITEITTTAPHLFKSNRLTTLIGKTPVHLRFIRLEIDKQKCAFYDINRFYLTTPKYGRYDRVDIAHVLEQYTGRYLLYKQSLTDIIKECEDSKLFEFIKTSNKLQQAELAQNILDMLGTFEVYCSESAKNKEVLGQFRHYALSKIFDEPTAKAALLAEDLGVDNDTIINLLLTGKLKIDANVELPEIVF